MIFFKKNKLLLSLFIFRSRCYHPIKNIRWKQQQVRLLYSWRNLLSFFIDCIGCSIFDVRKTSCVQNVLCACLEAGETTAAQPNFLSFCFQLCPFLARYSSSSSNNGFGSLPSSPLNKKAKCGASEICAKVVNRWRKQKWTVRYIFQTNLFKAILIYFQNSFK